MYPPAAAPPLPSADDSSAVSWLQALLAAAWARGASDLHLEPYEHSYRVRLRIDGQLQPVAAPPASLKERIASRIKVLARLDIAEKRLPQDGQFRLELPAGQTGDLRVSTLPTLFGEKIVIRLLPTDNAQVQLDALHDVGVRAGDGAGCGQGNLLAGGGSPIIPPPPSLCKGRRAARTPGNTWFALQEGPVGREGSWSGAGGYGQEGRGGRVGHPSTGPLL